MAGTGDAATGAARFEMTIGASGLSSEPLEFVSDGELIWISPPAGEIIEGSPDDVGGLITGS